MTISEVTAVTTTDLTGSLGLVSWGAATHITGATTHCHAQIGTSEKLFRSDKYRRAKELAYRGAPGGSTGTNIIVAFRRGRYGRMRQAGTRRFRCDNDSP